MAACTAKAAEGVGGMRLRRNQQCPPRFNLGLWVYQRGVEMRGWGYNGGPEGRVLVNGWVVRGEWMVCEEVEGEVWWVVGLEG